MKFPFLKYTYYLLPKCILSKIYNVPFWELHFDIVDRKIKKRISKMTLKELEEGNAKNSHLYEDLFNDD